MSKEKKKSKNGRQKKEQTLKQTYAVFGEGDSEFYYFSALKKLRPDTQIDLEPNRPKHPDLKALLQKLDELITKGQYNKIFVLIDLDVIERKENKAIKQQYENARKKHVKDGRIVFIENHPCLEYWFLLHHQYSSGKVDCNDVLKDLKKWIADYEKNEIIEKLYLTHFQAREETALKNARKSCRAYAEKSQENRSELFKFFDAIG